jgi:hypothetical protein
MKEGGEGGKSKREEKGGLNGNDWKKRVKVGGWGVC